MPIYLHHYTELFCLLVALFCYKKLKGSAFVWFIPFLAFTLGAELYATYLAHTKEKNNYIVYNILTIISFVFYAWFLLGQIESKRIKNILGWLTITVFIISILNAFYINSNTFHRSTFVAGCLVIVLYCFVYLYQVIKKYDIGFRIEKEPVFWIVLGLLFFYLSGAGFFSFLNYFSRELREQFNEIVRWLSVFMYGCFSIAFILCSGNKKKL
jgi:hypothetical protein